MTTTLYTHHIGRSTIQTPEADRAKAFFEGQAATAAISDAVEQFNEDEYLNAIVDERVDGPFVRVTLDDLDAGQGDVNRRAKLTPYRRAKLTPFYCVAIRA
jgi:hypothetical protein